MKEVFDTVNNGEFSNDMSYYIFKLFLNLYDIQLDRTVTAGMRNIIMKLTGAQILDQQKENVKELLAENEEKHMKETNNKGRKDNYDGRE